MPSELDLDAIEERYNRLKASIKTRDESNKDEYGSREKDTYTTEWGWYNLGEAYLDDTPLLLKEIKRLREERKHSQICLEISGGYPCYCESDDEEGDPDE